MNILKINRSQLAIVGFHVGLLVSILVTEERVSAKMRGALIMTLRHDTFSLK